MQRFGGPGQRADLRPDAVHGGDERPPQLGDMDGGGHLGGQRGHRREVAGAVLVPLVVLEFQRANHLGPEAERQDDNALGVDPRHRHPRILGGVVHDHRLRRHDGFPPQQVELRGDVPPPAAAHLAAVRQRHQSSSSRR